MPVDFHRPILLVLESPFLLTQQPMSEVEEEDGAMTGSNAAFHREGLPEMGVSDR